MNIIHVYVIYVHMYICRIRGGPGSSKRHPSVWHLPWGLLAGVIQVCPKVVFLEGWRWHIFPHTCVTLVQRVGGYVNNKEDIVNKCIHFIYIYINGERDAQRCTCICM